MLSPKANGFGCSSEKARERVMIPIGTLIKKHHHRWILESIAAKTLCPYR
jgi:hypothetical protein